MRKTAFVCVFIALALAGMWAIWFPYAQIGTFVLPIVAFVLLIYDSSFRCEGKDSSFRYEWKYERKRIGDFRKDDVFLVKALRYLFIFLYLIVPSRWISGTRYHRYLARIGIHKPYRCIEFYVIAWCVLEALILIILAVRNSTAIVDNQILILRIIIPYLCFRLFDIFQSWVNQFILQKDWKPVDMNRSLVLAIINYAEIGIIGAIIRYTNQQDIRIWKSLDNSVMSMIANPQPPSSPIQYTQIVFSVLFLVVVIQHVVNSISSRVNL